MHAKTEESNLDTFVLSQDTIRTIVNLVKPDFEEMAINASCNDQTFRGFENVDELASYPNARASRINVLSLGGYRGKSKNLESFNLNWAIDERGHMSLVKLVISGDNDKVASLRSRIRDILEETKPWYWRISKFDFQQFYALLLAFCLLYSGFVYAELTYDIFSLESKAEKVEMPAMNWNTIKKISWVLVFVLIVFSIVMTLINWIIIKPKRYLFPSGVILIGAEISRQKDNEKFRILFLGMVASILTSIVIAVFFQM